MIQDHLHRRFFFETSLLIELNLHRAVVIEVPLPARYGIESSSLSVLRSLLEFPYCLLRGFLRRIWLQYFVLDFSVGSLFLAVGIMLILFGSGWGAWAWNRSNQSGVPATTGTVMIAVLPFFLGFQLLLQALVLDVGSVPKKVKNRRVTD